MNFFPIQIVRTGEQRVVERLGKYNRTLNAGFNFIIPFVENTKKCSIKQSIIDTPASKMITKDNVTVSIDAIIFYRVTDSYKAIYKIENFKRAISFSAITNLRSIVGSMSLDQLLSERERINTQLLEVLDKITDEYGIKIVSVDIQDISLSDEIEEAMNLEKSSALSKKALILKSEGEKQSAIEKSTGLKESMILEAQGKKEKLLLEAEAESKYKEKLAEAQKIEMQKILEVFEGDIKKYLEFKKLECMTNMANGDSNKLIIPTDLLNSVGGFNTLIEGVKGNNSNKDNDLIQK